jgi:pilus assembly protein CpaE
VQPGAAEIGKADFEASIERKIDYTIPYDQKAAVSAAKLGQTFVDANRATKAGAAIREIAKAVLGAGESAAEDAEEAGGSSLLGKFDLKTLLGKKGSGKGKSKPLQEPAEAAE